MPELKEVVKNENMLLFLREFTNELVRNSKSKESILEEREEQMLETEQTAFEKMLPVFKKQETIMPRVPAYKPILKSGLIRPIQSSIKPEGLIKPLTKQFQQTQQIQQQIKPEQTAKEAEIDLGKLNSFIKDNRITMIECKGAGELILVRAAGLVNLTKISLSESEINEIIQKFSEKAKIPIIEGLFKAAVGNLIITAVISDFVGSRFIITKMTPYSLLEKPVERK